MSPALGHPLAPENIPAERPLCARKRTPVLTLPLDQAQKFTRMGLPLFGLSKLSVWWLRLGIRIERIKPATRSRAADTSACI